MPDSGQKPTIADRYRALKAEREQEEAAERETYERRQRATYWRLLKGDTYLKSRGRPFFRLVVDGSIRAEMYEQCFVYFHWNDRIVIIRDSQNCFDEVERKIGIGQAEIRQTGHRPFPDTPAHPRHSREQMAIEFRLRYPSPEKEAFRYIDDGIEFLNQSERETGNIGPIGHWGRSHSRMARKALEYRQSWLRYSQHAYWNEQTRHLLQSVHIALDDIPPYVPYLGWRACLCAEKAMTALGFKIYRDTMEELAEVTRPEIDKRLQKYQ